MSASPYLTPAEVAEMLAVGAGRVFAWIRAGELPAMHVSVTTKSQRPQYRIARGDFDAFLDARRVRTRRGPRRRREPYPHLV